MTQLQRIELTATVVPPGTSVTFGNPAIKKLGWVKFKYGGFYGPLQYVNSVNAVLFPENNSCTGFLYIPQPGVTWQITYYTVPNGGASIQVNGTAQNLMTGDVSELETLY